METELKTAIWKIANAAIEMHEDKINGQEFEEYAIKALKAVKNNAVLPHVNGSLRDKIIDMLEDKRMTTICGVDENMYYLSRKESADYLLDIFDIREKQ